MLTHVVILPDELLGSVHGACRFFEKFSKDYLHNKVQVS